MAQNCQNIIKIYGQTEFLPLRPICIVQSYRSSHISHHFSHSIFSCFVHGHAKGLFRFELLHWTHYKSSDLFFWTLLQLVWKQELFYLHGWTKIENVRVKMYLNLNFICLRNFQNRWLFEDQNRVTAPENKSREK